MIPATFIKPEDPAVRGTVRLPGRTMPLRYAIGDTVFHRLAREREPGLVTGLLIRPGSTIYYVTWAATREGLHYEMELDADFTPDFGTEQR